MAMLLSSLPNLFQSGPTSHNGALIKSSSILFRAVRHAIPWGSTGTLVDVTTASDRWSDALSYRIAEEPLDGLADADALVIECKVRVTHGKVGVGVTKDDGSTFASLERTVPEGPAAETLRIWVREPKSARHLLFRNVSTDGQPSQFELLRLAAYAKIGGRDFVASWSSSQAESIPLTELGALSDWAGDLWDQPFPRAKAPSMRGEIQIVDERDLPPLLGISVELDVSQDRIDKPLYNWKMETDDAPILEYLWRAQSPRRHLEFGTWEGFGTRLVARATDAEIWTINLPAGEAQADGTPLYASTDSGEFIGRMYREAGYSERVNQLLCDSRAFDTTKFGPEHFDTVLIDGGHTPDIVTSDTDKALRVLRPGGMCVWHDFCPDPETLAKNLAPLGVVQAVVENFDRWRPHFEKLFWIRKSWMLVGYWRK
jgi:predicted O-methyltransferase YrrM